MTIIEISEFIKAIDFSLITIENLKNIILNPVNITLFILNILAYFSASTIIKKFDEDNDKNTTKGKIKIFRFFAILFFILHLLDILTITLNIDNFFNGIFSNIALSILISYLSLFFYHVITHNLKEQLGETEKDSDDNYKKVPSYKTRTYNFLLFVAFSFFYVIIIVNLWDMESVLSATGILGVFFGFLALTSGIWGQDIYNGIILLHSKIIAENNIITFDGNFYIVYKTTPFETILFNIFNNARTVIRNKDLGNKTIDNITKMSHLQGHRISILYKIGYNIDFTKDPKTRVEQLKHNKERLKKALDETFDLALTDENIFINKKYYPDLSLVETGDFALHYEISFYLGEIEKTNSTLVARKYLKSKSLFNDIFFEKCVENDIDLSTPKLYSKI